MKSEFPGLMQMIRAPFLSSIISPLVIGSFVAADVTGQFDVVGFIAVMVMGLALHAATNVFNDVYDTIQGTDKVNVHRNEFSGGSGIIVDNPGMLSKMRHVALYALAVALPAGLIIFFRTGREGRMVIAVLFLMSVFFSKYYTAAPIKLAYRGLGEFSVWFAFGPMAVLAAAVSQHAGMDPQILAWMPVSGLSTLSILTIGQMIDRDADASAGKRGIAVRFGNRAAGRLYIAVQILLMINLVVIGFFFMQPGWLAVIPLIPCMIIFPGIAAVMHRSYRDVQALKSAAGDNVKLHLICSAACAVVAGVSAFF